MDRSAAWALFCIALPLLCVAAYAWTLDAPMDWYRTVILEPGGEPVFGLGVEKVDLDTILKESAVQGLRRAPVLVAAFAIAVALFVVLRTDPNSRRPTLEQLYVTLAPLAIASTVGAAVFTPPDLLTMLLLLAVQWVMILPAATVILFTVRKIWCPASTTAAS